MRKLITLIFIALVTTATLADTVRIGGEHEDHILEGGGRNFEISGHHHDVVINGQAGVITIRGHHIDVVVGVPAGNISVAKISIIKTKGRRFLWPKASYNLAARKVHRRSMGRLSVVSPCLKRRAYLAVTPSAR